MVSAFYDLPKSDKANATKYIQTADSIIENLMSSYRSQEKKNRGFILQEWSEEIPVTLSLS